MRAHTAIVFALVLVVLAALLPGCSSGNAASGAGGEDGGEGGEARLQIGGRPGTEFVGSCTVGNGEPTKIGGEAPRRFSFDLGERPLKCELSSDDNLRVLLAVGDDTHSTQSISGGTLHLTYENGSVSTSTSSASHDARAATSSHAGTNANGPGGKPGGPLTKVSRNVSGFHGVELRGVGDLSIEQTGHESLTVEAEKAVVPKITTRVVNGLLIIGPASGSTIQATGPINYHLTVKDLNSLEVLGTASAKATGMETKNLKVTVGGAGNVRMEGRADEQSVDVSGTSTYQAKNLQSKEIDIDVAGAGSAVVNARDKLDAEITGAGSVKYVGNPSIQKSVTGAGQVSAY